MRPRSPTAQPSFVPAKDTLCSTDPVRLTFDHDAPPFTVRSTTPLLPTAQPVSGFVKQTSIRLSPEDKACRVHVLPPSSVRSTVPEFPTAEPVAGPENHTPFRVA